MPRSLWFAAILSIFVPACGGDPAGPGSGRLPGGPVSEWQNPRPHNNTYRGMEILGGGRVVTISLHDALATDDDGATWRTIHRGGRYRHLHRRTNTLVILTTDRVLVSTDGGESFTATAPHGIEALAVAFLDDIHGIVVGQDGKIATTADGGSTWAARPSGTVMSLNDVEYLDAATILIAADDRLVLRSADGGATWAALPTTPFSDDLLAIDVTATVTRVTGTAREVYVSTNGGDDWDAYDVTAPDILTDIEFLDMTVGMVAGGDGFVAVSDDGGVNWTEVSPPDADALYQAALAGGGEMWAAGDGGKIFRTTNGGTTWSPLREGFGTYLLDVSFVDASHGIAVGFVEPVAGTSEFRCGILYTSDGGNTWRRGQAGASTNCESTSLNAVCMLDSRNAVAAGYDGHVWTTSNGGATWSQRDAGTDDTFHDVHFADGERGLAVGENGRKRITSDGGLTWTAGAAGTNTTEVLTGVSMASRNVALAVGHNGTARRTENGGQTWAIVGSGLTGFRMEDVVMLDEMTAVAIGLDGSQGAVFRSTDGGESWEPQPSDLDDVVAISFGSGTLGFITEYESRHLHATTDGGQTWERVPIPTGNVLGVTAVDEHLVFMVGRNGTILRMTR